MRFKSLKTREQHSQKKRNASVNSLRKLEIMSAWTCFLLVKSVTLEVASFFFFKKILKQFVKTKYSRFKTFGVWVPLCLNMPISFKSKNSRMGKGVGLFTRWSYRLSKNCVIMGFFGINRILLKRLLLSWNKLLPSTIYMN